MRCARCDALLSASARFCGQCGEVCALPVERPEAVASYREAMVAVLAGGPLEDWAAHELAALRDELGVHPATHERLLGELSPGPAAPPPVSLELDAASMQRFTAGAPGLLRLRVRNEGPRALKAVRVACASSALGAPIEQKSRALGPGLEDDLTFAFQPTLAGQHQLQVLVSVIDMRDGEVALRAAAVSFSVAHRDTAPSTVVTQIDASSLRVGTFDNMRIHAGAEASGGLLAEHDFRPLSLSAVSAAAASSLRRSWGLAAVDRRPAASPTPASAAPRGARSADAGRRKVDLWNELLDLQGRIAEAGSRRTPEVASLHHRAAELQEALGNKDQALAAFEKACALDPLRPAWSMDLALAVQRKGDLPRAEKLLDALLRTPLDAASGVTAADVHCALAELFLRQGDRPKAHDAAQRALAADPRHAAALRLREQAGRSQK